MCLHPGVVYKVIQRSLADYFIVIRGFGPPQRPPPLLSFPPHHSWWAPRCGRAVRPHTSVPFGPVLAHVISHDLRRCTQGRRTEETTRLWFKYPAGGIFQVKLVKCRWPYGRSVLPAPPADLAATRSTGLFPRQLRLPSCVFGEVPGGPVREIEIQIQICGAVTFSLTIDISHLSESPCPTPRSSSFCISKSSPRVF